MSNLVGVAELTRKLNEIGGALGVKAMRSAVRKAVVPVMAQMRAAAPVGTQPHRSYKTGRLLTPGFLRRSIRVITKVDAAKGTVSAVIGTRKEAYYGVRFYDQGPITVDQRRVGVNRNSVRSAHTRVLKDGRVRAVRETETRRRGREKRKIKPYTLRQVPFFQSVFTRNQANMERALTDALRTAVEKAANGR